MKITRKQLRKLINEAVLLEMGGPSHFEFMGEKYPVPYYLSGGSDKALEPIIQALQKIGDALKPMNHLEFTVVDFGGDGGELFSICIEDDGLRRPLLEQIKRLLEKKVSEYKYSVNDIGAIRSSMDPKVSGLGESYLTVSM